ncbi:MAG: DUF1573 domain-containing protein [Planctomycetota bacterium]|nr:DUF1573 domain-containing protein [Planctomycetota bacterium]MDA1139509.1 DUF1573 domain-containing protein [Planctomycetota bacterium]
MQLKVFVLVSAVILLLPEAAFCKPKINFTDPAYNFGEVLAGKSVVHEFKFKNTGDADLVIQEVTTSCGCTAALASEGTIKPGMSGVIKASFDTAGRRSFQTKTVTVKSNDPDHLSMSLKIEGRVVPIVDIDPNFINFGSNVRSGESVVKSTRVFTSLKRSFKILNMDSNVPEVTCQPNAYEKEGESGYEITVTLSQEAKPGDYSGKVTMRLDDKEMEFVELHFYGKVLGAVIPTPSYFVFGRIKTTETVTKELTLSGPQGKSFKILSSKVPEKFLRLDVEEQGQKKILKLTAEGAPEGRMRGNVVIETDIPGDPPLEIPVYGRVMD